jgi:hypothetical protein
MREGHRVSLDGQTVLLLGGALSESYDQPVKEEGFEIVSEDEYDVRLEEAVMSLVRAVLVRGGRLAFPDDPIVTPLAIEIGMEYWQSLPGEELGAGKEEHDPKGTPLLIIDSESEHKSRERFDFALKIGCAKVVSEEVVGSVPISRVVCIGGARSVREMLNRFSKGWREPVPVYAIPSTGGTAKDLVETNEARDAEGQIADAIVARRRGLYFRPPEREESDREGREPKSFFEHPMSEEEHVPEFRYALYPLVMSFLLDSDRDGAPRPQSAI